MMPSSLWRSSLARLMRRIKEILSIVVDEKFSTYP